MMTPKYKTTAEADAAYREYIDYHIAAVQWVEAQFGTLICKEIFVHRNEYHSMDAVRLYRLLSHIVADHDKSKYTDEEFIAYRQYFCPSMEDKLPDTVKYQAFDYAWQHHYTTNRHHPEYWGSLNYQQLTEVKMPDEFFAEMICDWIAVSLTKHSSLYDWWFNSETHSDKAQFIDTDDMNFLDAFITKYKVMFDFSDR